LLVGRTPRRTPALEVHHLERLLRRTGDRRTLVPSDTLLHAANIYYFSVHFRR
jgi:hypothetical protein